LPEIDNLIQNLGGAPKLERSLNECMQWIVKSFEVNEGYFSAGWKTVLGKWSDPYYETTGYIIPTLAAYEERYSSEVVSAILEKQLNSLIKLQKKDGSFPRSPDRPSPLVFDTAQLLIGLIHISSRSSSNAKKALNAIRSTLKWLKSHLDNEGEFTAYNYVDDYNPLYYSRIAWPLIQAEMTIESKPSPESKMMLERIASQVEKGDSLENWGLYPEKPIMTHNIAYTLRGIWECAQILNHREYEKLIKKKLNGLLPIIRNEGLAGSYNNGWKGDHSFICVTGHAQLALLYLLVYEKI